VAQNNDAMIRGMSCSSNKSILRQAQYLSFDIYDYRAVLFFSMCLLYALFGSPTPDSLGIIEFLIGGMLILSIGFVRFYEVFTKPIRFRFWKSAGQFYFLYGIVFATLTGAMLGTNLSLMLRDIIPFMFLFLPLFLLPLLRERPEYFRLALFGVVLIGLFFSLRSLTIKFIPNCAMWCTSELLYLENMPTVLFSALFLLGQGARQILHQRQTTVKDVIIFYGYAALSLLPMSAMALSLQRASIGAVIIYLGLILIFSFYKTPRSAMRLLGALAVVAIIIGFSGDYIYMALTQKSSSVGLNMRPEEARAVWEELTVHPFSFLFGLGWGSHFNSPAVGGLSVNFTHNFFTSALLKTGFIGFVLAIAYICGLLERLSRVMIKDYIFGFALCAPIIIDLTLYASFKSLDFGLVILLISGALVYSRAQDSSDALISN